MDFKSDFEINVIMTSAFSLDTPGGIPVVINSLINYFPSFGDMQYKFFHLTCDKTYNFAGHQRSDREIFSSEYAQARTYIQDFAQGKIDKQSLDLALDDLAHIVAKELSFLNAQLIHSHTDWYFVSRISEIMDIPHIATLHGMMPSDDSFRKDGIKAPSNGQMFNFMNANATYHQCIAISPYVLKEYLKFGLSPSKTTVIKNPIGYLDDLETGYEPMRGRLEIPECAKLICFPQRPSKLGSNWMFSQLKKLLSINKELYLLFCIGNDSVDNFAYKLFEGVSSRVIVKSFLPHEMFSVYKASDVTVLPNPTEPFGIPAYESLYCGTAAVMPNDGNYKDAFGTNMPGVYLFSPYNEKSFIFNVLSAFDARKKHNICLPQDISNESNPAYAANKYADVYESALLYSTKIRQGGLMSYGVSYNSYI